MDKITFPKIRWDHLLSMHGSHATGFWFKNRKSKIAVSPKLSYDGAIDWLNKNWPRMLVDETFEQEVLLK